MSRRDQNQLRGFTLLELVVAMAIGLIVLGAAVSLFTRAVNLSFMVTQRAEMQQNGRAALDMMAKDISLAGAGIPSGGVQLPDGAGATASKFACDTTQCYVTNNQFPLSNNLFGLIPNPSVGLPLKTTSGALGPNTDVLTVAYTDSTFPLNQYTAVFMNTAGTLVQFQIPNPLPIPLPTPWPPTAVNDPAQGLAPGDLVLLTNNVGSAVAEVTLVAAAGANVNVTFADLDTLNVNQSAAALGNIKAIAGGSGTVASRLLLISYYIDIPAGSDGVRYTTDDGPPRLMRQIGGHPPTPVAENISGLQVTYDIFNDVSGVATAGLRDAGMSTGQSPNEIRKVNLIVSTRSPLQGVVGYQTLDLATAVSARDMSFKNRYN
ncbi:MAG TPA: prepilin-type N-terminal cleavage/methylation domain-containing protein [Terriglobales bacterium]|nr:prepilin-type N-terminal cleavage/methylation domain-containing protein [Terriglobales bacterium]